MFVVLLALMIALWVLWWLQMVFAGTFGAVLKAMWQLCCAAHKKQDEELVEAVKTGGEDLDTLGAKVKARHIGNGAIMAP